jgi:mono/diheme cytochrome c family protein
MAQQAVRSRPERSDVSIRRACLAVFAAVGAVWLGGGQVLAQPLPPRPEDPTAAKAYAVFDSLCAACHQNGKLKAAVAGGGFANILDLEAVARTPAWVRPGQPDGSPLYMHMQMRTPPHDADASGRELDVGAPELEAVRDWIAGLPAAAGCTDRLRPTRTDLDAAVTRQLEAAADRASRLRFLSLAESHAACAPEDELTALRATATVAVNSLSWALQPVRLPATGPGRLLLTIDLEAIGWTAERWERLARQYPYAATAPAGAAAQTLSGSEQPVLRADWFVATALRGSTYIDLLGLPDQIATLTSSLRIDQAADIKAGRVQRIAVRTSGIARGSRLLQRHGFANGAFWATSEYAPTPGRADLVESFLATDGRPLPKPDASLVHFNLPNGFTAFFMTNGDGMRVGDLPHSVLRNDAQPRVRLAAGAPCLACHLNGPRPTTDEARVPAAAEPGAPKDGRERVSAQPPSSEPSSGIVEADRRRTRDALAAAGVAELPAIAAVIAAYDRAVPLEQLAVELGISPVTLRAAAGRAGSSDLPPAIVDTLQRLLHAAVPRLVVEAHFRWLLQAAGPQPGPIELPPPELVEEPFALVLKTDATTFRAGDLFAVRARVTQACHLTLINIDHSGRGTVIFPNDFEPNGLIEPGKELRVPAAAAAYQFRLRETGRESVVGICQVTTKTPSGIRHDFERMRFTELGDYRAFLNRTLANEPAARAAQQKADERPAARTNRRARPTDLPAPPPPRGEAQARAAVQIVVLP